MWMTYLFGQEKNVKGKINNQGQLEILRPRINSNSGTKCTVCEYLLVNCLNGGYCDDRCVYFGEPIKKILLPLCKKDLIFEELIDERVILVK